MGRYDVPDPKCTHVRRGLVFAGDPRGGPHASTAVCDRTECIGDAMEWVRALTHLDPTFRPDPQKVVIDHG